MDALTPADFNLDRIQVKEPGPIPWGLIDGTFDVTAQIDGRLEREAHELAAPVRAG